MRGVLILPIIAILILGCTHRKSVNHSLMLETIENSFKDKKTRVRLENGDKHTGKISLSEGGSRVLLTSRNGNVQYFVPDEVKSISITSHPKGAMKGFLGGMFIGIVQGLAGGDGKVGLAKTDAEETALFRGILYGGIGGLIGLMKGSTNTIVFTKADSSAL